MTGGNAQRSKNRLNAHTVAARPARAIDRVSGMLFGQTATQFWALPQTWMPPWPVSASSRSPAIIFPVGWELKSMAWLIACGPTKPESKAAFRRCSNSASLSPSRRETSTFVH